MRPASTALVYAGIVALALLPLATHSVLVFAPPAGTAPTYLHTGDSAHHLAALRAVETGFFSPWNTADDGRDWRLFAPPIFGLYALLGAPITPCLGARGEFLYLGLLNSLGAALFLLAGWQVMRATAPRYAGRAMLLWLMGGGIAGALDLVFRLGNAAAAVNYQNTFYPAAQYALIEGQHPLPWLLFARLYYTLPLALGLFALARLLQGRGFMWLLALAALLNFRAGGLVWLAGACYLLTAHPRDARAWARWTLPAALGGLLCYALSGLSPHYLDNVSMIAREAVWPLSLFCALTLGVLLMPLVLWRGIGQLPPHARSVAFGLSGFVVAFLLLHFGYRAWFGLVLRGGETAAAAWSADRALAGLGIALLLSHALPAARRTDGGHWPILWLLASLALGFAAFGQGWALQFAPARTLVLLGLPLALVLARHLEAWRPFPRRALLSAYALLGLAGLASASLFYQYPLGHDPAHPRAFGYLHYSVMTPDDTAALAALPPGAVVLAPAWTPIAFGELATTQPGVRVYGGPGAMNLSPRPFAGHYDDVLFFFAADRPEFNRRALLEAEPEITHVWLPAGSRATWPLRETLGAQLGLRRIGPENSSVLLEIPR